MALFEIILGFVLIVGVGVVLRRFGLLAAADARPINAIIIYAGLPALIFRAVHGARLEGDLVTVALAAWGVFVVTLAFAWLASRPLRLEPAVRGGFVLAAALGNTGYIGYPVTVALLGDEGLVKAIFSDVFGTVAALLLVGLFIAERYGTAPGQRVNLLKEALTFPAVIALAVGLALRSVAIPTLVGGAIDALASLVVPLIMVSVGLSLRPGCLRERAVPLAAIGAIKLLFAPLVAVGIVSLLGGEDAVAAQVIVLEASMPSMMLTLVVGDRFGLDTDFIASAILVTTVVSVATIPLMQLLVA